MNRWVHAAKSVFAVVVAYSGVLALLQRLRRPHVVVLAYHRVTPDAQLAAVAYPAMHVSTSSFEAQLCALRRHYTIVPMAELRAHLLRGEPLRRHLAVVTFDDGYRDNYEHAMPILIRHGVPATFFLSLGFVDGSEPFWFDRLAEAARVWTTSSASAALRPKLPEPLVEALDAALPLAARVRMAAAFLKSCPDAERTQAMHRLAKLCGEVPGTNDAPMRWEEVRAMRETGMSIGAHGWSHSILTRLEPEAVRHELRTSLARLGERLQAPVTEFAYPNGDTDERVASMAKECGVRMAFTMAGRPVRPGDDPLWLARRNICEDTSRNSLQRFSRSYFWCEIAGIFDVVLRRDRRTR